MSKSDAEKKLRKARSLMVLDQPFFGCLALKLKLVKLKQWIGPPGTVPTLATDGEHLFYDEDFVKNTSLNLLISGVAHETLHNAMCHQLRRGNRDPNAWNIAGDFAINPLIKNSGMELGTGWAYDKKYEGWTAERIYEDLPEELKQGQQPGQGQCGCGGIVEPDHKPTPAEIEKAMQKAKQDLTSAATHAKMAGKLPAGLERYVDDIVKPPIDPADLLRRFMEEAARNDFSWRMPNTRFVQQGIYLPTLHSNEMGEIVIIVDTSGSIGAEELKKFAGLVSEILAVCRPQKVYVIYVDTEVGEVEEFEPDDLPLKLKCVGGGGTDFVPGFEWVHENGIDPRCLLYLTDMYCNSYPEPGNDFYPEYPVMWCTDHENSQAPFGETIQVWDSGTL